MRPSATPRQLRDGATEVTPSPMSTSALSAGGLQPQLWRMPRARLPHRAIWKLIWHLSLVAVIVWRLEKHRLVWLDVLGSPAVKVNSLHVTSQCQKQVTACTLHRISHSFGPCDPVAAVTTPDDTAGCFSQCGHLIGFHRGPPPGLS